LIAFLALLCVLAISGVLSYLKKSHPKFKFGENALSYNLLRLDHGGTKVRRG